MKYISFVVPCYNVEDYLEKCIDSLLIGGESVEIIIIDDGSKDRTGEIGDKYQKKYPKIVKCIHQKNGGHGEGINQGLKIATGKYFKVIDADDWADPKAYKELLKRIKKIDSDVIVMNYVYEYTNGKKRVINFSNIFKHDKEITWNKTGMFRPHQYLSLHSLMFKKSVLDKTKINLPKHCSYEDNLFIYLPLINTETVYYLNVDFYRYFIGRDGQSMQESNLIKKNKDQVKVSKLVCNAYDLDRVKYNKKLYKIMKRECVLMMTIGTAFSRLNRNEEGEKDYKELWASLKKDNPKLYKKIRYTSLATFVSIPGKIGRAFGIFCFRFAHKVVKFN